jgi:uncharacterized protein (TIGR03032 family)
VVAERKQIPVLIVAAPGTETEFLVRSLSTDGGIAIATLVAGSDRDGRAVAFFADPLAQARLLFVAASRQEPTPADLTTLPSERWCRVERDRLLADPGAELHRLCAFIGIEYDQALLGPVEAARRTALADSADPAPSPFASASTSTFGQALEQSASSLLVSTYQTHRLVCARMAGGSLNTHFRAYDKPMGIATAPGRIALGTRTEVWDLRDMPEAAAKLEPLGGHDACYLVRNRHVTGDIAVHDLAFAGGELWLVATAFSCLATLDGAHSFVPRWTPSFITSLAPEDRCHLNGLAVRDGRVAQVTALGVTDEPGGWRSGKATGGVLVDVATSEVAIAGLSMPHSPRWHDGRLWLLESGTGSLCIADLDGGSVQVVAELPGFTRGLAFIDGIAFVGLSQIRESTTFGNLPLTRRLRERQSGVWMVDLHTGEIIGFLRFDDLVQEIFDVAVLRGIRFPELAEAGDLTTARSYALP